jgi:hypothetical protein
MRVYVETTSPKLFERAKPSIIAVYAHGSHPDDLADAEFGASFRFRIALKKRLKFNPWQAPDPLAPTCDVEFVDQVLSTVERDSMRKWSRKSAVRL